jgi:hypothetical protein
VILDYLEDAPTATFRQVEKHLMLLDRAGHEVIKGVYQGPCRTDREREEPAVQREYRLRFLSEYRPQSREVEELAKAVVEAGLTVMTHRYCPRSLAPQRPGPCGAMAPWRRGDQYIDGLDPDLQRKVLSLLYLAPQHLDGICPPGGLAPLGPPLLSPTAPSFPAPRSLGGSPPTMPRTSPRARSTLTWPSRS